MGVRADPLVAGDPTSFDKRHNLPQAMRAPEFVWLSRSSSMLWQQQQLRRALCATIAHWLTSCSSVLPVPP